MMKKVLILLTAFALTCLIGCGNNEQVLVADNNPENSVVAPTKEPEATTEPTSIPEATEAPTPEPTEAPTPEPTEAPTPEPTEAPTPEPTEAPTPEPTVVPTPEPVSDEYPLERFLYDGRFCIHATKDRGVYDISLHDKKAWMAIDKYFTELEKLPPQTYRETYYETVYSAPIIKFSDETTKEELECCMKYLGNHMGYMHQDLYPEYPENGWLTVCNLPYFKEIIENKQDYTFYCLVFSHIYKDNNLTDIIGENYYLIKHDFKYVKD